MPNPRLTPAQCPELFCVQRLWQRPHKAGYALNRIYFYANRPCLHETRESAHQNSIFWIPLLRVLRDRVDTKTQRTHPHESEPGKVRPHKNICVYTNPSFFVFVFRIHPSTPTPKNELNLILANEHAQIQFSFSLSNQTEI